MRAGEKFGTASNFRQQRGNPMTTLAERWGIDQQQFWMHGRQPAHPVRFEETRKLWAVSGYPEAVQVISDPQRFSSNLLPLMPIEAAEAITDGNLIQMDPPDHRELRTLVSHAFTRKVVADLEPRIAEVTGELLDELAGQDRFDLVTGLAYPLPVIVIAELLGVPGSDQQLDVVSSASRWVRVWFGAL
ncbi:hypothetical protein [Saccharopolyspora sp. NPDC002376]